MTNPTDLLFPSHYADKETAVSRAKVCNTCDRLFRATFSCKECGCFMKAKVKLTDATCPLGKW